MRIDEYSIDEHLHRFGVWIAARAASKSRLSNFDVADIITFVDLRKEIEKLRTLGSLTDTFYRKWLFEMGSNMVQRVRNTQSRATKKANFKIDNFSFGIAAKIISVYIKTVEVLPSRGESLLSKIAYPPIDSILLKNLNTIHGTGFPTTWSKFEWRDYEQVVVRLNEYYPEQPKWKIEVCWKVSNDEALGLQ